jgi:hypothetical protein
MYLNICRECLGVGCNKCSDLGYTPSEVHEGYVAIIYSPVKTDGEMLLKMSKLRLTNREWCSILGIPGSQLALVLYRVCYMPDFMIDKVNEIGRRRGLWGLT